MNRGNYSSAGHLDMNTVNAPMEHTFDTLGIEPRLLAAIKALHITTPTPIQHQAIPPAIEGKDVVGIAQTGTGKTLAFGVPMLQRLVAVFIRATLGIVLILNGPANALALMLDLARGISADAARYHAGRPDR